MPKHDVFISYSTQDLAIMLQIYKDMRLQGLNVWIDKTGIKAGDSSWQDAIANAIKNTSCIVVLFSPYSAQSTWVKEELAFAQTNKKQIFPVLLHGNDANAVPFGYQNFQRVNIERSYDKLRLELFPQLSRFLGKNLPDNRNIPNETTIDDEIETIIEIAWLTLTGRGETSQSAGNAFKEIEKQRELARLRKKNAGLANIVEEERRKKEDYEGRIHQKNVALEQEKAKKNAEQKERQARDDAIKQERERQRKLEAEAKRLKLANARFQVNNPLHWLLFLWWIFVDPERLTNYTDRYTSDTNEAIVARLSSFLAWLSLLIPSLALSFNQIPLVMEYDWLRWFSLAFIPGFLITAWAVRKDIKFLFIVVFLLAGTVALFLGAAATNNENPSDNLLIMVWGIVSVFGLSFINAFVVIGHVSGNDELDPARLATGMVFILFAAWMIGYEMGIHAVLACGVGFVVAIAAVIGMVMLVNQPLQQRWLIIRLIAVFPFLTPYIALTWIYWLGGWQTLVRIFS